MALACLPIFATGLIARWQGTLFLGYYAAYVLHRTLAADGGRAMTRREYRKAKQRLRVEIRRHERPGKAAVEVVIAET